MLSALGTLLQVLVLHYSTYLQHPSALSVRVALPAAVQAGRGFSDQGVLDLVTEVSADVRREFEERHNISERCSKSLVDIMVRGGDDANYAAILLRTDRCVELLSTISVLADHPSDGVRSLVGEVLGGLGGSEAVPTLLMLLGDGDETVRATALRSLCSAAPAACTSRLSAAAVQDPSWRVRKRAVVLAKAMGYEFPAGELSSIVNDRVAAVRITALGHLSCKSIRAVEGNVMRFTMSEEKEVKFAAIRALGRCQFVAAGKLLLEVFDEEIRREEDEEKVVILLEALVKCAGEEAKVPIETYVSQHRSPEEAGDVSASNVRSALEVAYEALGNIGNVTSARVLRKGLYDPYYRVRLATIRSMVALNLGHRFRVEMSKLAAADPSEAVRELARTVAE